jgi:hypothetical protein
MRKLKPKYLFASAALLILLVVVVYVVTRSKEPIPNNSWPGYDVPNEEDIRARLQGLREVSDDPSVQRTLTYYDEDIRPVTAQQATPPYLLSPEVAPEQPMLEDVQEHTGDLVTRSVLSDVITESIQEIIDTVALANARTFSEINTRLDALDQRMDELATSTRSAIALSSDGVALFLEAVQDTTAVIQEETVDMKMQIASLQSATDAIQQTNANMQMQIDATDQRVYHIIRNSGEYMGDGNS